MKKLAYEYSQSAKRLKQRLVFLKQLAKSKDANTQKGLEDRIMLLSAEYYYLLKTAKDLANYYKNDKEREVE